MDHSSHAHHMGMDHHAETEAAARCSMNMLFTWNTENLCIVFRQWHVRSTVGLIFSLLAIVAIGVGYEALREGIRRYEAAANKRVETAPRQNKDEVTRQAHVIKAVLYGVQNFYAFMVMLIFMTYNGWVMVSVSVGAGLGYLIFGGRTPLTKETACH
ncbi:putative copper transport protein [Lasiosphaeria miniovina]|uniref:Copper transport protein n=1 Tax=Lasiosphaeria miniovina TaxID=1954250 RepID=A0AA40BIT4_9PEZI|nr:putative copper transport protein [Lasiosphaeria miniovina]KAK0734995.1 putative copper transport protein [Lasiosphaeria miniovina]